MEYSTIRRHLSFLRHTPLHPQWFACRQERRQLQHIAKRTQGNIILDIGCSDQHIRNYLPPDAVYIGLDYYNTATYLYNTTPQIYGDAQRLPFKESTVDSILLLNVLEHLKKPMECISEINRILKPHGRFILHMPFMYPLHDRPFDYQRFSIHGLRELINQNDLEILEVTAIGKPLETATLCLNLAVSKTVLDWLKHKNPACILVMLLPFFICLTNLVALLFSRISPDDDIMPFGYQLLCTKRQ
jgi:SAM-dependent methyltransferase